PSTKPMPSRAAAVAASDHPPRPSWSVSATMSRPAPTAASITSVGVQVPSDTVEWVCRSMRIARRGYPITGADVRASNERGGGDPASRAGEGDRRDVAVRADVDGDLIELSGPV